VPPDFGVCSPVTLAAEGYYEEYDYQVGLLPESPMPPGVTTNYVFAADPGFQAGEVITGDAAGPGIVEELTFDAAAAPSPPFVRGETLTDGVTGTTAIVGRRYSDGRYLVYDVTGAWNIGVAGVTGSSGGGGVVAGTPDLNVAITAVFDSVHWKNNSVMLFRNQMGIFPPGSTVRGAASGAVAQVIQADCPQMTAELSDLKSQIDTAENPQGVMLKVALLYGDLAQLNYDLGAVADYGQRRAARNELFWHADVLQAYSESSATTSFAMNLMRLEGHWEPTVPVPAALGPTVIHAPSFKDGLLIRLYVSGTKKIAALTDPIATRQLTFNEHWLFQERFR